MDAISDPGVEKVTGMTSAQVGKTEILNNAIGFYISQDPAPILLIEPTLEMSDAWSKDRFAPMLRDTPCLRGKVSEPRSRTGDNTIRHKSFPGGHITTAGANSAASLASRPVRIVIKDELDRFPPSAGTEGDPAKLADKRAQTFWNRKLVSMSTPTIKGVSRIEAEWGESDQRHYYVPCLKCGEEQILVWQQIKWDKKKDGNPDLDTVHYECIGCKVRLGEAEKSEMVRRGKWIASRPEITRHAGFQINELYSPWSSWRKIVEEFIEAKKRPESLKVWVNTVLGECWEDQEQYSIDVAKLAERIESYVDLPLGVLLLTASVDVQDDRLVSKVKGWGLGDESWFVEYKSFFGSPGRSDLWIQLDDFISRKWIREDGLEISVFSVCIDSGGHFTDAVYQYVRRHRSRRYFAVKGFGGFGKVFIGKITRNNKYRALLLPLGVDTAKELIFDRLAIENPGPGYMHFNQACDEEYFLQLTAEHCITKYNKGFPTKVWVKKDTRRNEALDCEVYALAAYTLLNANMPVLAKKMQARASALAKAPAPGETPGAPAQAHLPPGIRKIGRLSAKSDFVNSWRRW